MRVVCFILALFMAGAPLCAYEQINIVGNYKSFSYKKPVATAEHGARVYVLDKDYGRLAIFTSGEKLPSFVGSTGEGKDQFSEPSGLAILESRNLIFVADTGNNRIQILNENGQFLGSFGGSGSDQGRMSAPGAVAVGIDGRVYVADTGNDRIDVFTPDGIYMFDFPIASPSAIAADPGGNIYVLGAGTNEVIKFDPDGKKLASIKIKGDNFCVTKTGFLYVSSYEDGKIREYTPDGNFSGEFGTRGKAAGQFYKLSGISVAGNGDIIVSDYGQKTVSRINFVNSTKYPEITASTATRIMLSGPAENKGRQTQFPFTVYEGGSVWYNTETKAFFTDQSSKTAFGAYGKNTGETREPEGIADYKGKTFYVSDSGNNRIQVFSHEGKLLKVIGEKTGFMGSSSKEGRMNKPAGLAVESNGNVTVADEGNSRIQQFSKDGMFICAMGPKIGDKKFSRPVAVVILPDSHRLVLDRSAKKVFELFPTGALARYWGSEGSKPGQFIDPVSMAYDGREFIYVLDAGDARVKVFNLKGEYQGAFFAKGKGPGEYEEPKQIAFFKNGLYITDPALGKNDFYTFDVSPAPPSSATVTVNEDSVNLVWQESDSNWLSGYKVYRSTQTDGTYTLVASTSATEVTETGLKAPLTYYYKIAAVSQTGTEGLKSQAIETFVPGNLNVPKLSLDKTDIGYIFSANYKYYLKNPIGTIELSNNTDKAFKDVKLSFEMKEFMDFPFDTMIKRIPARDKVVV
ncbi:MAG: 6-bladed beta-propeller, partial [Elusimicrobiaceae bacterium]